MAVLQLPSGRRIFYDDTGGDAPVALLFAGRIVSRKGWEFQIPALAPHLRVLTIDNRDAGDSDPEPEAYTLADMAGDGIALLDALGIARAHVLGHSMGSAIAARLVVDHPARVARLILASGRMFARQPGADPIAAFPRDQWIADPVDRRRVRAAFSVAPGYFDTRPDRLAQVAEQERGNRLTYEGVLRQMGSVASYPSRAQLEAVATPTLVLHGDQDTLIPVAGGIELAQTIPGARLLIFPGVGHSPHIECTDAFNAAVCAFFAGDQVGMPATA